MKEIADNICKKKVLILILTCILFVLSIIGYFMTGVNYDILVYLPEDIETVKGQNILIDEFDMGAYSVVLAKDLNSKEIANLKQAYLDIDGVNKVLSIYDLLGDNIPIEMLPNDIVSHVHDEDTDILFVTFKDGTSAESTINAINEMREISKNKALISGMSSMVVDTMNLSKSEIAIYIIIAVILCLIVLEIFLDSYLVPVILLGNIGISIIFNLGTNVIFGEISYITKALVAVLQLGVTMDFSIFLYHAYEKEKESKLINDAMSSAIIKTFSSVTGSSITTIVGFLALCAMDLTLGRDLGLVMAKGVLIGVICVLTVFPSFLLLLDKYIMKTKHRAISLNFAWLNKIVIKHHVAIFIIFIILVVPFYLANSKIDVYYKIDRSLPDTLESIVANKEIKERFNIVSPEILLIPSNLKTGDESNLIEEIKKVEGIDLVLSTNDLSKYGLTNNILPSDFRESLESENYQLVLINSLYEVASDELNKQINEVNKITSKYDSNIILAGEGALTKDLVTISDNDFKNVNTYSIGLVMVVMLIVLKSISLPILLVMVIEFAIFVNMGISYFSGNVLPFVAPIVLGTIQLGATIDYAILMTTNYLEKRKKKNKEEAMLESANYCIPSIIVSGLCFFAATFGVGIISKLEMVGSLCALISRGAIISMLVVILILPSVLLIFDKLIFKTTLNNGDVKKMNRKKIKKNIKRVGVLSLALLVILQPIGVLAYAKEETVYSKRDANGVSKSVIVNDYINNSKNEDILKDMSDLKDIVNLSGDETFEYKDNNLIWKARGNNILYQGTTKKELPVDEEITYKLDGKKITIDELLGKSGNVEITIKYTNKDLYKVKVNGKKEKLYTPFVVTTAMMLDNEVNKNVKVENGKVIDNGNNYVIAGLSAPGLYDSLKIASLKDIHKVVISYNTSKFELSSIYSVITPKLIDSEDLDVFKKMDEMYSSVDSLQDNMDVLEKNAKVISSNLKTVSKSTDKVYKSLNQVLTNLKQLKNGSSSLDSNMKLLLKSLENAKSDIDSDTTVNLLMDAYSKDQAKIVELSTDPTANAEMINILKLNMQAIGSSLQTMQDVSTSVDSMIKTVSSNMTKLSEGASQVNNGIVALENGVNVLTENVGVLNSGVKELSSGTNKFTKGISKYNKDGINELTKLKNKASKVTAKMNKLTKLADNYSTFTLVSNKSKDNSTKFIYVVDAIKYEDKKQEEKREVKKDTLWDRIVNLFK